MGDHQLISKLFDKLCLKELLRCKDTLESAINRAYVQHDQEVRSKRPEDYVVMEEGIAVDSVVYGSILADLEALKLKPNRNNPVTAWLTSTGKNYEWDSSNGHTTVKNPINIKDSNAIHELMQQINRKDGLDMNSCLVSYYARGNVYARLHDDAEETLDQTQPICVVSLGAKRTIDFFHQGQDGRSKPSHSITPDDGSLYRMQPGCQQYFRHRVRSDPREPSPRYCLSFRRMLPHPEPGSPASPSKDGNIAVSSPVKNLIKQYEASNLPDQNGSVAPNVAAIRCTPPPKSRKFANPPKRKRTTVMFGTSITLNLDESKLSKMAGGRKFINVSANGAKIRDIIDNMQYFYVNNPAAKDVEKILFCLGTNDVKYSRRGVGHLKRFVIDLINEAKFLFPGAIILFFCCLPIQNLYWYTVSNVHNFNRMLRTLCYENNCVYVNCFRDFLSADGSDYNSDLYRNWLHLNWPGKSILCSWLKYVISQTSFNFAFDRIMG